MLTLPTFNEYLTERASYEALSEFNHNMMDDMRFIDEPINEGGAAGHMNHPFDDMGLTFGDLKKMATAALSGNLSFEEDPTEKVDGQNLFVTIDNGKVLFSRNKGQLKNPLTLSELIDKFKDHPSEAVRNTFTFAAEDLARLLPKLSNKVQQDYFNDGKNWLNIELIYSKNPNVINYDTDVIQFHDLQKTDGEGNILSVERKPSTEIAKILSDIEANYGKIFQIVPPRIIKLRKDIDFSKNQKKFISKIETLKKKYNLSDGDTVSMYNEMWWRDLIDKNFKSLPNDIKQGLVLRWAYDDKKSLNWRSLSNDLNKEQVDLIKKFDKEDLKQKQKENIEPFQDIFLELGSIVLKNASNLLTISPDKETQRLQQSLRKTADEVLNSDDTRSIDRVKSELERLNRIGGIESIVPTEGIVFRYNGKNYKLTGTYAAINQLMGIMKYGR